MVAVVNTARYRKKTRVGKGAETKMVNKEKSLARIARGDGSVAPHQEAGNAKTHATASDGGKVEPHDRESEVTLSITQEKLICPRCGKPALHVEFPDHYEAWTKCPECGFFMGMSNEEWHRMESSSNLNLKIKKMAIVKELVDPRPGTDSAITEVSGYLLCLGLSLLMLVFLVFIVVPDCANMAIASGGTASCETGGGTYLFGIAFVAITLLAGFRLGTIVFPARTV